MSNERQKMVKMAANCSAADGVTQTFDFGDGTPLMVRADDFNALFAETARLKMLVNEAPNFFHPGYDFDGKKMAWFVRAGLFEEEK